MVALVGADEVAAFGATEVVVVAGLVAALVGVVVGVVAGAAGLELCAAVVAAVEDGSGVDDADDDGAVSDAVVAPLVSELPPVVADSDDEVAGVGESLGGGALGVLVGGATAGTSSVADGGTV